MPNLELKLEFQNYCHKYAFPQNDCAMYMVSSSMKEIYIPFFIEKYLPRNERIINEFSSGIYSGHMMCFDQELGYLYVIPSTKGDLCVYSIGKETEKAFSNLMKVAAMDTLHLPWRW